MTAFGCFLGFSIAAVVLFVVTVVWQLFAVKSFFNTSNRIFNNSEVDFGDLKNKISRFYVTVVLYLLTIVSAIASGISLIAHLVG